MQGAQRIRTALRVFVHHSNAISLSLPCLFAWRMATFLKRTVTRLNLAFSLNFISFDREEGFRR
jgi:hypothetical protein